MAHLAYGEAYAMSRIQARDYRVTTYQQMGSMSETARRWPTSGQVVRKWAIRYKA